MLFRSNASSIHICESIEISLSKKTMSFLVFLRITRIYMIIVLLLSATQANAIAVVIEKNFHVPMWVTGLGIGLLTAVVIFGGIKSIASVCEKLVPVMALFYVIGCIVVLVYNYDYIIPAIKVICRLAFTKSAIAESLVGDGIKYAIQYRQRDRKSVV